MLVRRVAIENVRSFLDRAELMLDGQISIIIGPNGGGKTNLLDTIVIMLRRYLFASMYAVHTPTPEKPNRHEFRHNDVLNNMVLERHSAGAGRDQLVEVEVEVTSRDLENMRSMQTDADRLTELANKKYANFNLTLAKSWKIEEISAGTRFIYRVVNGSLQQDIGDAGASFLQYLQMFEMDGRLREEFELAPLATPLVYLPVNRSASGFQSNVELAGYNDFETKRHSDTASSRSVTSIVNLAVGRLAQKYRMLLEKDKGIAASEFRDDVNLKQLTNLLSELGYEWSLETINPLKNQYDIRLKKQGSSFLVGAASSGERELLTYLFAIFALNVRDALVIVDEPELHLHPKWQKILLQLFIRLAQSTGNQFLLATHAPTFVSPESIQYVSRVFSHHQRSHILRLNTTILPEAKHLLNIVNSQNNERLFFADEVVLVEGLSDRVFFEAVLDRYGRSLSSKSILEVISVGGKGFFEAYAKVLRSCEIQYSIISDLDYVEQVGSPEIKALFKTDTREIKTDVLENVKSFDGDALVQAIDQALSSGNWEHATQVWDYIKARRRQLRKDLSAESSAVLEAFLVSKRTERVYILGRGSLEAYLPVGHGSKEIDKLIRLLSRNDFWEQLPQHGKAELELIAQSLLPNSELTESLA
ncbi:AAA family ATPase [Ralstonia nicotianae]|uniref:AAA family ATPase n=4 Tax=Ralstonia pseudosolanacearum TaxID=1310165 RepID=UPI001433044C|nr:ATP-dependent endonuclease [Ralstonia solanacearum]